MTSNSEIDFSSPLAIISILILLQKYFKVVKIQILGI